MLRNFQTAKDLSVSNVLTGKTKISNFALQLGQEKLSLEEQEKLTLAWALSQKSQKTIDI